MGIFSRRPKIPPPHITYNLTSSPSGHYRPSSPVSGTINFSCPTTRQVRWITACFYGLCTTHNTRTESRTTGPNGQTQTRTIHYHDDVELFRFNQDLTGGRGEFTALENEESHFNFAFTFPATTAALRQDPYERDTAGSDAYDVQVHELPPSYYLDSSTVATVAYRVEVAVLLDDDQEPTVNQLEELEFSPFPPNFGPNFQPPFLEFVKKKEKYSSSRLIGQEKSFRASIKDKFSSHTPSLEVTMKASLVPILTTGTPFQIYFCAEVGKLSDPAISVPNVRFWIKEIRLYEYTKLRALRVSGSSHPEHETMVDEKTLLNGIPEVQVVDVQQAPPQAYLSPMPSKDSKDTKGRRRSASSSSSDSSTSSSQPTIPQIIFPTSFSARVPSAIVPSFRTVNINHHFTLRVEVELEIAGKEFEHEFEVGDVTVLPLAAGPGTGASMSNITQ